MKSSSEHNILFSNLKFGIHHFDYLIENSFLAAFPESPTNEGRVWVNLSLSRHETMMVLDFSVKGTLVLPCARCNESFDFPVEGEQRLIVKFGEESKEEMDEILILPHGTHEFNIAQYIYEFIMLAIPLKVEHPVDENGVETCDKDALSVLEKFSGKSNSTESDPRWDVLKKLKKT